LSIIGNFVVNFRACGSTLRILQEYLGYSVIKTILNQKIFWNRALFAKLRKSPLHIIDLKERKYMENSKKLIASSFKFEKTAIFE
jgi:hypothetical protein